MKISEAISVLRTEVEHEGTRFCLYGNLEHMTYITHKVFGVPTFYSTTCMVSDVLYDRKWRSMKCYVYHVNVRKRNDIRTYRMEAERYTFDSGQYGDVYFPVVFWCSAEPCKCLCMREYESEQFRKRFFILDCTNLENDTAHAWLDN